MQNVNFLENLERRKEHPITLILGFVIFTSIVRIIDNSIYEYFVNPFYRIIPYLLINGIWFYSWYKIRTWLPKNNSEKVTIVICIDAETDKQKLQLRKDFVKRIFDTIHKYDQDHILNIIVLNEYHSESKTKLFEKIVKIFSKIKEGNKLSKDERLIEKRFNKINKQLKGNFYVYGNIKERNDIEKNYFFNLDAIVLHPTINDEIHKRFQNEIDRLWIRNIKFKSSIELKGFQLSADLVLLNAQYIIGIALLISGKIKLAELLHLNVEKKLVIPRFHHQKLSI